MIWTLLLSYATFTLAKYGTWTMDVEVGGVIITVDIDIWELGRL